MPRALLTVLIALAVLVPYWFLSREAPARPAGSASTSNAPPALPTRGGAVVTTSRTDPRSFNRLMVPEFATELHALLTLGKLVRVNRATQEVEPWLAERWELGADQRSYTLTLRQGVTWSDGTPFTADDVVFSFEAAYDPRAKSPVGTSLRTNGRPLAVSATAPHTVVVTFPAVFGPGLRVLDNLTIMPKHKLATALIKGEFGAAWPASTPPSDLAALGPFVLREYLPAQRLVYERNPRYWRKDERGEPLPYLDRITMELVPDLDGEMLRLQSGQADFIQDAIRASDLEALRPLELQGRLNVQELGVTPNADAMVFNLRPARWAADPRGAWLSRKEFRQALSHAVDREAFANTVFLGAAVPIFGPVTPGNRRWFWPSTPRREFSRDKARALLQAVGLEQRDQDEALEDARGTEARFTLLAFRGNPILERSAAVLREDFRQVGVIADVVALEPNAVRTRVLGGDFDSALIQFTAADFDPAISRDFWLSSGGAHFWNPQQATPATDWEKQIDDLMGQQSATTNDEERTRLFIEVQRLFAEHVPVLYFAAPRVFVASSARLVNLQPSLIRPQLIWSADTLAVSDAGITR